MSLKRTFSTSSLRPQGGGAEGLRPGGRGGPAGSGQPEAERKGPGPDPGPARGGENREPAGRGAAGPHPQNPLPGPTQLPGTTPA